MSDLDELIEEARKCAPGDCSTELAVIVHRLADALEAATSVPVQGGLNDDREALHWCLGAIPGHVWDELHEIGDVTGIIDAILAAGFSRATVPDAATDAREHLHAKCDCVPDLGPAHCHLCSNVKGSTVPWGECEAVVAERDAALARIAELEVERDRALEGVADQRRGIARRMEDIAALEVENLDLEARIAEAAKLHRPFEWSFGYGPVKSCRGCADRGVPQEKAEWPCDTRKALDGAPEPEWEWEYRPGHIDHSRDDEAFVQGSTIAPSYVQQYVAEGGEAIKRKVSPWLPVEGEKP